MNKRDLCEEVIQIIAETIKTTVEVVKQASNLDELGMDSVLFIEAVLHIEERFNIQFEDDMLVYFKFPDIDTLVNYVAKLCDQ